MLDVNLVQVVVNLQDHPRHVSAIKAPTIKLADWNQHAVVLHQWNQLVSCCSQHLSTAFLLVLPVQLVCTASIACMIF